MQNIPQHVKARFSQLQEEVNKLHINRNGEYQGRYSDGPDFHAWAASALSLILGVFGKASPHYLHLDEAIAKAKASYVTEESVVVCRGVFQGAKNDVEGGFIFNLEAQFSSEIFADFISAAKAALSEGRVSVAAVLASAALEDALKRYAAMNGLDVSEKTMEEVVNGLKTRGLVSGAQKGLLAAMPKIRNSAMHANWGDLTAEQAGSVIGFTEQFLLTNF